MVRSVIVVLIVTAAACVCAAPGQREARGATTSTNPQVGSFGVPLPSVTGGNFGADSFSSGHGGNAYGSGDGGHGGNFGNTYHGGSGDTGRITYM